MIRHIVLLRFRADVDSETRTALFDDLRRLQDRLAGVGGFHSGPNVSVETNLVRGNLDGFWFDFADAAARDAYLADDGHRALGARIVALTEGGLDGVTVFDMDI